MTTPPTETLLTIEQAAAMLAVNERMIRPLIETRRIAFVKVGRHVRFRKHDLIAAIVDWTIEPRKRTPTPGHGGTLLRDPLRLSGEPESVGDHSTHKP
jgi:excisionase family DNA binding protein